MGQVPLYKLIRDSNKEEKIRQRKTNYLFWFADLRPRLIWTGIAKVIFTIIFTIICITKLSVNPEDNIDLVILIGMIYTLASLLITALSFVIKCPLFMGIGSLVVMIILIALAIALMASISESRIAMMAIFNAMLIFDIIRIIGVSIGIKYLNKWFEDEGAEGYPGISKITFNVKEDAK